MNGLEHRILKHLETLFLFFIAIYSYRSRNFLIFTNVAFRIIPNFGLVPDVDAYKFIDKPVSAISSYYSVFAAIKHPDYEIILQVALLLFVLINIIIKNLYNVMKCHHSNGYIVRTDNEFNVSLTFVIEETFPCYSIHESINIKYPLNTGRTTMLALKTSRCETETTICSYIINSNGIFTLSDPFYVYGVAPSGEQSFTVMPFDVSFDLKSIQWIGHKPLTINRNRGGSCSLIIVRNPYFGAQSSF